MKVRITKCPKKSWWYNSYIGETFEVTQDRKGDYEVTEDEYRKLLETEETEGVLGYHIKAEDCEVVPKFSIGSKVLITQPNHWLNGKTGTIIAPYDSKTYPWRVEIDGGDRDVFEKKYMELIVEEQCTPTDKQWFTKAEALHMALDGAKIINENWASCGSYVSFDGKNFRFGESNMIANGVLDYEDHWKIYEEPKPTPKFTKDTFVKDDNGDYGRIVSMEYKGNTWMYKLSDCVDNDGAWEKAEGDIGVA